MGVGVTPGEAVAGGREGAAGEAAGSTLRREQPTEVIKKRDTKKRAIMCIMMSITEAAARR